MTTPREKKIDEAQYGVLLREGVSSVCDLYERAWRALDAGDTQRARALYEQALCYEPANAQGYIGVGSCAMQEQNFELALTHYLHALDLDPASASAHVGLGSIHYQSGRFAESARHYEHATRLREELADAHWGAATAFERLGDRAKMRTYAKRFLDLAPDTALSARAQAMLDDTPRSWWRSVRDRLTRG